MDSIKLYALGLLVLLIFGLVGHMDRDDELAAQVRREQAYCRRVHQNLWPDYRHNYEQICTPDGLYKEQP